MDRKTRGGARQRETPGGAAPFVWLPVRLVGTAPAVVFAGLRVEQWRRRRVWVLWGSTDSPSGFWLGDGREIVPGYDGVLWRWIAEESRVGPMLCDFGVVAGRAGWIWDRPRGECRIGPLEDALRWAARMNTKGAPWHDAPPIPMHHDLGEISDAVFRREGRRMRLRDLASAVFEEAVEMELCEREVREQLRGGGAARTCARRER